MHPERYIFCVAYVPVNEGCVLFLVAVVVERDHLEVAEARGQVPDGGDLHAHLVRPNPIARVVAAGVQKLLDLHWRQ